MELLETNDIVKLSMQATSIFFLQKSVIFRGLNYQNGAVSGGLMLIDLIY